jgi:type II secretory pathway pseudopilin PulG
VDPREAELMFAALATWAAGKFGGMAGKLIELIVALALLLVLVGGPYWLGWSHRGSVDDAAASRTLAAQQAHYEQQLAELQARGEAIAARKIADDASAQINYRALREEVPRVTTIRPAPAASCPAAAALPARAEFSVGFVGVWNDALAAAADDLPARPSGAAGAASGPDPALTPTDVDQADVLSNHIDNAEQYAGCRRQLDALIDWVQSTEGR